MTAAFAAPNARPDAEASAPGDHGLVQAMDGETSVTATFREDLGHVSVLEVSGNYDRESDGETNAAARATVSEAFLAEHEDAYDFLIAFTRFPVDLGEARGFHWLVRNEVEGIGLPLYDQTAAFGSSGRLSGYSDLGRLAELGTEPGTEEFERTLTVLIHELFHQWGAYVHYDDAGTSSPGLLGKDDSHWSFLLDTEASVLFGNCWRDNQDGTYTSTAVERILSPLDLYLAGFLSPDEVPPLTLLSNPSIDRERLPELGAVITASAEIVGIDDVVAAEGVRDPSAEEAPHDFQAAFLYLVRPGEPVSSEELAALERIREGLLLRFTAATGARAALEIHSSAGSGGGGGPGTTGGGDPRVVPASVADALAWLRSRQRSDGSWSDRPATGIRDTTTALQALLRLDPTFGGADRDGAVAWLEGQVPPSTDHLARAIAALSAEGRPTAEALDSLLTRQNADGGWGLLPALASDPLDSALALGSMAAAAPSSPSAAIEAGKLYLLERQNVDGGWGPVPGGAGSIHTTSAALRALAAAGDAEALGPALQWLLARQNSDGGFGDSPSTAHHTAEVIETLAALGRVDQLPDGGASARAYLESRQDAAGSWEGSVFTTSLAAEALQRLSHANWYFIDQPEVEPESPFDGQVVHLAVTAANDGALATPPGLVRLFDGDPAAGAVLDEVTLPPLDAGASAPIQLTWDTTSAVGVHQLIVLVDPFDEVGELSETDNRAEISVEVAEAPEGIELIVRPEELVVSPSHPDRLPAQILIQAVVRNVGQSIATQVGVALSAGDPTEPLEEQLTHVDVPPRSSSPVSFLFDLTQAGTTELRVVADPNDEIVEVDEGNNVAASSVTTVPSFDLEVLDSDLELIEGPAHLGADVTFRVDLHNRGTSDTPSTEVFLAVSDGTTTVELPSLQVQLAAGESVERTVVWRVDRIGSLVLRAAIDPDNLLPEIDESNNSGALGFESTALTEANLTVSSSDLTSTPDPALEGSPALLSLPVRNIGGAATGPFAVAFYDGAPEEGAPLLGSVPVGSIDGGAIAAVDFPWTEVPAGDRFIHVVVDPDDEVAEANETDNRAFRLLEVLGLPDAAVGAASLQFDPEIPSPGQSVTLTVRVTNAGEQALHDLVVRTWEGEPGTGTAIGADQVIPSVEGQATGEALFTWVLEEGPAARTISVAVDPDGVVDESDESNNEAQALLGAQAEEVFVSERYFSPDGNGVQDETTLFFSLDEPTDVEVRVVDRVRDRLVYTFTGSELEHVQVGEVTWDGRDDGGRLVRDAEYELRVVDLAGTVLRSALTTVDTDRSSLLLAIGTPYEYRTNLTCEMDGSLGGVVIPPTEDYAYLALSGSANPSFPDGIYRRSLPSGAFSPIVPPSWLAGREPSRLAVSRDGRRIAFTLSSSPGSTELWAAAANGGGLLELPLDFNPLEPGEGMGAPQVLSFGPSGDSLIVASYAGFVAEYSLLSPGDPVRWWEIDTSSQPVDVSPDGRRIAMVDDNDGGSVVVLDLQTASVQTFLAQTGGAWPAYPRWSPDGSTLAVASTELGAMFLYDTEGTGLGSVPIPQQRPMVDGPLHYFLPRWRGDGSEILLESWDGLCSLFDLIDVATLTYENLFTACAGGITGPTTGTFLGPSSLGDGIHWDPSDRSALRGRLDIGNVEYDPTAIFFDEEFREEPFIPGWSTSAFRFSAHGHYLRFWSDLVAEESPPTCQGEDDWWLTTSLENLTADLRVRVPPSGGYLLEGTAIDLHLDRYELEWRRADGSDPWHPVAPPVETQVLDDYLGTWIAPGPGTYQLRLTAFDRAGNHLSRIRQVSSSTTPDITDVTVTPGLISPNGDEILDEVTIAYRVLRPVVFDIVVFDEDDQPVRTFHRSHPLAGETVSLAWDGRDDAGLRVPDGNHRVLVQVYDFFTAVDATPPQVSEPSMVPALLPPVTGSDRARLQLDVQAGAADDHLSELVLQRGEGALPSAWSNVPAICDGNGMAEGCEARVPVEGFVGFSFRAVADDAAANRTIVAAPLAPEALRITGFGRHRIDPATGLLAPLTSTHEQTGFAFEHGAVRFSATEAVREDLQSVSIQYRPQGEQTWTDLTVPEFRDPATGEIVPWIPQPRFEVLWGLEELVPGGTWDLRLEAIDSAGTEHLSQPLSLRTDGLLFHGRLMPDTVPPELAGVLAELVAESGADPARDLLLWAEEWVAAPLERATLFVSSEDDPRYETVHTFEPVATRDGVLLYALTEWKACATYTARVEVSVAGTPATPPRTLVSQTVSVRLPCLELTFEIEPVVSSGCGGGPDDARTVTLRPRSLDGAALQLLSLFGPGENGEEELLYTVSEPTSGQDYEYSIDLDALPEGSFSLRARLTNIGGEEAAGIPRAASPAVLETGSLIVDRSLPEARVTFPIPGQVVCPKSPTVPGALDVQGEILDDRGASYALEWGLGASPIAWQRPHDPLGSLLHDVGGSFGPAGGLYSKDAAGALVKELSTAPFQGVIGRLDGVDGELSVRLRVADSGGSLVCSEPVTFSLDALLVGATVGTSQYLLSPNGDGVLDTVTVTVAAAEPSVLDLRVFPGLMTDEGPVITGPLVRTLASGLALESSAPFVWDGHDEGGSVVEDGTYLAMAQWVDGCGNEDVRLAQVEVDTTPPDVEITSPTPTTPLPLLVTVWGAVDDPRLFTWTLSWGEGPDPEAWLPLGSGLVPIPTPEPLAVWNTFGLSGIHTLQLTADDEAGNRTETRVTVDIEEHAGLIADLAADPSLFSPNGDGRREDVAIHFGLEAPCAVDLVVVDSADQVIAVLLDAVDLPEGEHQAGWDGAEAIDGLYRVRLEARLTAEPAVVQTEEVPVTLDRTAPTVLVERPSDGGWISGSGSLLGTIADDHIESWSIRIAGPQSGSPWQEIAAGDTSLLDAVLGTLPGVEEGDYSLEIVAEDRAEIRTEVTLGFGVDDTLPVAELTAPVDGTLVGAPSSPFSVEGTATDEHLDAWFLELGDGSEPDDWTVLLSSGEPASGELLAWDASALSDGPRTLRLRVVDRAVNESTAVVGVEVDNTPPIASISQPAEGSYVTAALDVVGSASDLHLEGYVLEALRPDGTLVDTIAEETEEVTDAALGRWTNLPPDGPHLLRLTVRDQVGHVTTAETSVEVDTHPPAAPTGLTADPVESDEVRLEWNANTEPDLVGYRVYREGTPLFADPISGTTWLDSGLPPGAYEYTVTALDRAGLESDPSAPAGATLDVTPPTAEIHAPVTGDIVAGLVDVRGTAWSIDDFARYRLTVIPEAGGTAVLLEDSTAPVQASLLGQWDTSGLTEGAAYTITLEAEDLVGNRATSQVTVTVDNEAPAAPTGLVATVDGSDVHLGWDANAEPDLLGYLLYRGDDLVNAEGPIIGDLRPYALTETEYDDLSRPDGEYTYIVYALDAAGNLSPPSSPAPAVVETGPPHALVIRPDDGTTFEAPAYVLATVDAFDIAAVQLQYREVPSGTWLDLGSPVTAPPYDGLLDPLAPIPPLVHGDYELRAVATDDSDNTDPDPATITVTYADLTAPEVPTGLAAVVGGGTVSLSWDPLDEPDLDGYLVYRTDGQGTEAQVTASPIPEPALQDPDLVDDQYAYTVTAVDVNGNESERAPAVPARVYTPSVVQPLTPRLATTVTIRGDGPPSGAEVSGEQLTETGPLPLPVLSVDPDGRFSIVDLPLPLGRNEIRLRATDPAGNVSKDAFVPLDVATPPSAPTGLTAIADGLDVNLSWDPNPEPDLLGYRPHREGAPLLPDVLADDLAAISSEGAADEAVDGDPETSWWVNDPTEGKWLEISWPDERIVTSCTLEWVSFGEDVYSAESFQLLAWSGEVWVSLFEIEGNDAAMNEIVLPQAYRTDRLRVLFGVSDFAGLSEASVVQRPTVATATYLDQPGDGVHHYDLTAVSSFAFQSTPSGTVEVAVGDVEPPSPVVLAGTVLGSDVELTWTESASPDVVSYEIVRDGETVSVQTDLSQLLYLDSGRPNGTYRYVVRALDAAGNRSVDSNEVVAVVAVELLGPPRNLQATALPTGRSVLLEWDPPEVDPPVAYRVRRSPAHGGPYAPVVETTDTTIEDVDLENGVPYYWVVEALDAIGNASPPSNEATATPQDSQAPAPPILHHPTVSGLPLVVPQSALPLAASAEPGASVTFVRNGEEIGSALASTDDALVRGGFLEGPEVRLSPDGTRLWGTVWDPESNEWSSRIVRFDGSAPVELGPHGDFARWSRDGRALLHLHGGEIRSLDLTSGEDVLLATADDVDAVEPSPDGASLAVIGQHGGSSRRVWLVRVDTETWTDIAGISSGGSVVWSPDGSGFAFGDDEWFLYDLDTAMLAPLATDVEGTPSWLADGTGLLLARSESGDTQIWSYDGTTAELLRLTDDPVEAAWPRAAPDGTGFVYLSDRTDLILASADGVPLRNLTEPENPCFSCALQWVRGGAVLLHSDWDYEWVRIVPAGTATLGPVSLAAGENRFRSTAKDAAGNRSGPSAEILVTRSSVGLPDLVVTPDDLEVSPPAPLVGTSAQVTLHVRNQGDAVASNAYATATLIGADGVLTPVFENRPLPDLAPGEETTSSAQITLSGPPGIHHLVALVDPLDLLVERDESNNLADRPFPVVDSQEPILSAVTDRSAYGAFETVEGRVTLSYGGPPLDAILRIAIEDEGRTGVAVLYEEPLHLEAGTILDVPLSWPTEDTWAGRYSLAAGLTEIGGSPLAAADAPFDILEDLEVEATIRTGQPLYRVGDPVGVVATVDYATGNALLDGAVLESEVVEPEGFVVESRSTALGTMLPGDTASVDFWWASEGAPAGSYSLRATLSRAGTEIATAAGTFELEAPSTQITGTLALSNSAPPIGESVTASWTVLLTGSDPLLSVPLRVRVLEPISGVTVQIEESIVDLEPGTPVSASVPVVTDELEAIPYVVLLQAEIDDEAGVPIEVNLAVETLWPVDGEPPLLEILRPTPGQLLGLTSLSATLAASDPSDPIATVECRADGGVWFAAQPAPPGAATHWCDLSSLDDGPHTLSARARDETGNTTTEGPVPFEVDRTPPDIQVMGITGGGVYTDPVTPEILIAEAHPGQQTVLLDDLPFTSGTTVEEPGDHLLEVEAEDTAGNASEASVHFLLIPDGQSLELVVNTVNDVDDGHCDTEHCSLREAVRVANQDGSPDTILFAIPGVGGERVLRLREALPRITAPVTIDALSQPGATCDDGPAPVIVLDGGGLEADDDGMVLATTDVVLRGLSIVRFPGHGLRLTGGGRHTFDCSRVGALDESTKDTGNGGHGIYLEGGSADNRIGSTLCSGPCNVIAFNGQSGVGLAPSAGTGNEIRGNSIFRNGELGIDLGDDGLTLNDPLDGDEGPNRLQNYPVVTAVRPGETSEVDVVVQATPEHDLGIDLFRVDSINGDRDGVRVPPPFGEADHLLAQSTVSTDASGEGTVTVSVPEDLSTSAVTATATDLGTGDTSELSSAFVAHFTHSLIADLRAVTNARGAGEVEWRTSSESGVLGFRLFRRVAAADGGELGWEELTRAPILALEEAPEGALYSVPVEGVQAGDRLQLLLIEEGTRGNRRVYGPFATTVTEGSPWNASVDSGRERRAPSSHRSRRPSGSVASPAQPHDVSRVAKLGILEEGLYRVEADEIAAVVDLDGAEVRLRLATHRARMEAGGQPVGWLAEDDGSALYFFGEPADDPYSPVNVYWLDLESTSAEVEYSGRAPGPVSGGWFPSTVHAEENALAATNLALDPDEDFWFWTVLVAGAAERTLPFDLTDLAPAGSGSSRVELDLYAPPAPGASEAHQVSLRINDLPVGSSTWSGWGWQHLEFVFPDSALQDGENQLTLSSDLPQGATLSFSYVDGFSVTYPRRLEASDGALLITEPVGEIVTVEGLTTATPWVVDVSAGGSSARVVDLTITGRGPWSASWAPPLSSNRFWAGDPSTAALAPAWILADAPSRWQDGRNSADLLVVSTPPLLDALEPLLERRESEGLLVARVDIQDVYDETNGGLASPRALQEFLRRVAERWALPPRYVLLGGAGSFDYRDHLGVGGNLVPPLLARTDDGLFSTDMELGEVTGNGIPDIVVGRIPARTPEEMAAYVDKVLLSETAAGGWAGASVLVADGRDGTADFGADSQALAGTVPGAPPTLLLRDALPLPELRDELLARLQSGLGLLHYLGHGGIGQLGVQAILSTADVPTLTNAPYLPVVLAPTCVANRYELPTTLSLGEALVLQPGGGASAVLSASGLSQHGAALRLSQSWLERPWPVPGERLGDRVLSTLREAGGLRTYTLLGDPTLHLPTDQQ